MAEKMNTMPSTSEIVEYVDEIDEDLKIREHGRDQFMLKSGNRYFIEDDINRLFEAIEIRTPSRVSGFSSEIGRRDALRKSAMKRPVGVGYSHASGIGVSEPVSLKQALRGLCISQASEMAAMKKRSPKQASSSRVSDAGTIKRLYRTVVVEASGTGNPLNEGKGNLVEISLVPEKIPSSFSDKMPESLQMPNEEFFNQNSSSSDNATIENAVITRLSSPGQIVPLVTESKSEVSKAELENQNPVDSSSVNHAVEEGPEISCSPTQACVKTPVHDKEPEAKLHAESSVSVSSAAGKVKSVRETPRMIKPVFGKKSFIRKKAKHEPPSSVDVSNACNGCLSNDLGPITSNSDKKTQKHASGNGRLENTEVSPVSSNTDCSIEVDSSMVDTSSKSTLSSNYNNRNKALFTKADDRSRSREKGEFSQSSKSSIGEYSSSTTTSEESNVSGSNWSGSRPHMSKDSRWEAIHSVQKQYGSLSLTHFKLLKKLGSGDIGTVYLAELTGITNCLFALKVMDNDFLSSRKKMLRAQTEKEIMQMLDHPFLPTLYAYFVTEKLSCLVMEYCPGGDLHVLRQKQPWKSFSEQAARFYVAEVLLALEYLHMLGVVYRDLKPENILVREDGHIMVTDFDLSLRCVVNPVLLKSASPVTELAEKMSTPCAESSCIEPLCLNPSFQVPCFTPSLLSVSSKSRRIKSDLATQSPMPQLVVEPTSARSNSFVGTHEYLAPEIIKGEGHGNAVDWWTFGIFLFELLYGKTPFKGSGNDETLSNVVSHSLRFPSRPMVSFHARDLIRGLLVKEPENRLGSVKGAAEIKQHPFFEGLNWALVRCSIPPEMPRFFDPGFCVPDSSLQKQNDPKGQELQVPQDPMEEFDMF